MYIIRREYKMQDPHSSLLVHCVGLVVLAEVRQDRLVERHCCGIGRPFSSQENLFVGHCCPTCPLPPFTLPLLLATTGDRVGRGGPRYYHSAVPIVVGAVQRIKVLEILLQSPPHRPISRRIHTNRPSVQTALLNCAPCASGGRGIAALTSDRPTKVPGQCLVVLQLCPSE